MADPFVAEIRIFPFNFAPKGWALCNGQLLPISQNTALFSLLGTTYGGDGKSTFALPDLQGSAPMHPGQGPGLSLHDLGRDRRLGDRDAAADARCRRTRTRVQRRRRDPADAQTRPRSRARGALGDGSIVPADRRNAVSMAPQALAPAGGGLPHNNLHAVPDAQLLHRAAGRLPAAAVGMRVALRPVRAGRRAVPAPRLREHARGGARAGAVDARAEGRVPGAAVRGPDARTTRSTTPG